MVKIPDQGLGWYMETSERGGGYNCKKAKIKSIENAAQFRSLLPSELECRATCQKFVKEFEAIKARDIKQKALIRWAVEGDESSVYFNGILNANLSSIRLHGIMVEGEWISNPTMAKDRAYDFFANKFKEPQLSRPRLVCSGIRKLSGSEASSLVKPFSILELKDAVWECEGDRAPGPDGFNIKFLKHCCHCFQGDFM
ncbi:uncharacterized protein LOC143622629 [Bidens hawaiensis]|uniref:uncharacterized protein LOC143622629 n=1 Tax=Bidens hawaiensis TaxID=980011 RepID=UPI0040496AA0